MFRLLHDVRSLVGAGTQLPCGYMEQLRVCLKVLCNSQEWHPSPLVSLKVLISCGHTPSVPDPHVTLGPWLAQVHTYPVGGYMEQLVRLSSCGHTPSWSRVQDPRVALSLWLAQVVHIYPVATGTAHNNFTFCIACVCLRLQMIDVTFKRALMMPAA